MEDAGYKNSQLCCAQKPDDIHIYAQLVILQTEARGSVDLIGMLAPNLRNLNVRAVLMNDYAEEIPYKVPFGVLCRNG